MTDVPAVVGVFGGGRMGAGIAHAYLLAGAEVRVIEADAAAGAAARERVHTDVVRSDERGKLPSGTGIDATMARLTVTEDVGALAAAELVIEAVPENPGLKAEVLGRAAGVLNDSAVLASNTSSLSIDELAAVLPAPERFLGMHFFNPVPASGLVEIVTGARTDDAVVGAARGWVSGIGKTPVTVRNSPGFASSRLGVALGLEAIRMVEEGVASADDIDAAMTLGYKHPVGPLKLTDIVGLDVRLAISEYLQSELGDRFRPPQLMRDMVEAGTLGKKTGRGFYDWS
ncbi:3-hydroxyacyl-CoA dehydrogenase family protein [Spelaeicoccus albus]|uniref:3-hydroxybutyryl-CoA dehydrogenase n=1 Tax=Spelaeicoccus albus TaxID=1280376 RepID=A0A7Z0D2A8_9MICO|nr:3-hydroxyacyl-CoA dehydrogenase family protein [Spelaeicoccus albus]NYI67523.1 3-hydroxybutyryl-CoA dehydrogenase [Spelaeicoccus albus]